MSSESTRPIAPLEYGVVSTRSKRIRQALIAVAAVLVLAVVGYLTWKHGVPALRRQLALRDVNRQLRAMDEQVAALSAMSQADRTVALPALSGRVAAVLAAWRRLPPTPSPTRGGTFRFGPAQRVFFVAGTQVIQAGMLTDETGKRWCVLVIGGTSEQASTMAWPAGSASVDSVLSSFAFEVGHGIQPRSRLKVAASQPVSDGKTLPVDFLLDGRLQHAALTIDSHGVPHANLDGWQRNDGAMAWGEVGRYGYRNVSVNVAPFKSLPHAEHVAAMRFISNDLLATADAKRLEVVNLTDSTTKVLDRSADAKRFYSRWRLSPDGRSFLVPDIPLRGLSVVDVQSGEQRHLAAIPVKEFACGDYGFESPTSVLMVDHDYLVRLSTSGEKLEVFDITTHDGAMEIVPSFSADQRHHGARGFPILSATEGTLAIGHPAGLFILSKTANGWGNSRRLGDWIGGSISLSPDGRWLARRDGSLIRVHDANTLAPVAEFSGEFYDYGKEVDRIAWSADGSLAALVLQGGRLGVCTLGREPKIAVELLATASTPRETFRGAFCLSPDGSLLASKVNDEEELNVWRVADILDQAIKTAAWAARDSSRVRSE